MNRSTTYVFCLVMVVVLASRAVAAPPAEIDPVCVDDRAIGYATFQSHNQKVVDGPGGIFMTYLRSRNEPYTAQAWRLLRSVDSGRTFVTVFEATNATNPPVLETDRQGNLYLIRPDFADGHAYLYRFSADHSFRDPRITRIPGGAAGKYAMVLDQRRQQLYLAAHNNTFHIVGLDGTVRKRLQLWKAGPHAVLQYPLICLDQSGHVHVAWTTEKRGQYRYWDIHHMVSPDGGNRWRNLDGTPLQLPVTADDTGPALRITLDDEFDCHTWLSSFLPKEGKLHFLYQAQCKPARQHYVRYDIATGKREEDVQPRFAGQDIELRGLGGFLATRGDRPNSPLYCIGNDHGRIACLASFDNGRHWRDQARGKKTFNLYSPGGCRRITDDGHVIGSFTDQVGSNATNDRRSRVYFFRF